MLNVPQRHVGVHFGGRVHNFSNSQHKVVVDPSVGAFHQKSAHACAGGEDVACATIRFRLRHGVPQVATLQCELTP